MKKVLGYIRETFFGAKLGFRIRLFNILAMTGMTLSLVSGIASIINNEGFFSTAANFSTTIIAFLLMWYASKSGRYRLCYLITIIAIFICAFSVIFFPGGGYEGAMPSYFIFAVIITVFMLEGKMAVVFSAAELLLYAGLCVYAYHYPKSVTPLQTRLAVLVDIVIGYTVVSVSLGTAMFLHFRMYNKQQRELEKAREEALAAKEILARQNDALEQLNRMKTEFLGNVSHELKTPLTVISGYAQLSERRLESEGKPDNAELIGKMKFISSEAERLALMVSQILDVTRIDEGRMDLCLKPCHTDEIIHAAITTHFPILNKNENTLEIRVEENLPMIQADPLRISQVIINLIANAIRFTRAGAITVSAKKRGEAVEISVGDTGSGISPAILPHIFERYYIPRSNTGLSDAGRDTGTGLGLFICRHIVEEHGGEITIESEPGKGTAVRFTVPVVNNAVTRNEVC